MAKNITIYIGDDLRKEMKKFPEVNWSEISRMGILRYLSARKTEEWIIPKILKRLDKAELDIALLKTIHKKDLLE